MEANKEILFNVEENHRGKWQPLIKENGKGKTVKITEEEAEIMNKQSEYHKIRYVKSIDDSNDSGDDSELKDLQVKYEEVIGKKPHHMKGADKLKAEIEEATK